MSRREYDDDYDYEEDYSDYGDEDYADDYSDVDHEYVGGDMPDDVPVDEEVNDYKPEEEEHVEEKSLFGVQKRILVFRVKGSLEQLNRHKGLTRRRLNERAHRHMKQVTSMTGRANPTDENTSGNLDRIIPLGARVVHKTNPYPKAMGYRFNQSVFVPETLTDDGKRFTGIIEAHQSPSDSNQSIFSPNNIFARRMLEKWERCDVEALEEEFIFKKVNGKEMCLVRVLDGPGLNRPSVAIDLLRTNAKLFPGISATRLMRNRLESMPYSELDPKVGKQLYDYMAGEIEKIKASFISVNDLSMSFHTADGQDWNTFTNLVGEAAALEPNKQGEHKKLVLNSTFEAAVHVELTFIPVPGGEKTAK